MAGFRTLVPVVIYLHVALSAADTCIVTPNVDRHLLRPALDARWQPVLGWTFSAGCGTLGTQQSYRVRILNSTKDQVWQSPRALQSNKSTSIPFAEWAMNMTSFLAPAMSYLIQVSPSLLSESSQLTSLPWSIATPFHTQLSQALYEQMPVYWNANLSAEFVMFRGTFGAVNPGSETFLSISAKPNPDITSWHTTSRLLCAYKLWVNGVPLGVGPGRKVGGAINVDTFNLTGLIGTKPALIAIETYYRSSDSSRSLMPSHSKQLQLPVSDDHGGVVAFLHNEAGQYFSFESWKSFDATAAFAPSFGSDTHGAGTHCYAQPYENIDMRLYPKGWRDLSFDDSNWSEAVKQDALADGLVAKEALPVSLKTIAAVRFDMLTQSVDTTGNRYHYVVDYGKNFQGHINITFKSGSSGQQIIVRLGEQRLENGSVNYRMESGNVYNFLWTLSGSSDNFVPHEYCEFRWAEIIGAPEPPSVDLIQGWQVSYPFDGNLNENPDDSFEKVRRFVGDAATASGITQFATNVAAVNQVWELAQHTVLAAALELNTDSNTRQRDLCALDAWVATRYQAGVAPGTSFHLRRKVTQSMYEKNGYVNYWTEFLVAHVGVLHDFTTDYDDTELASMLWNESNINMTDAPSSPGILGLDNYSLLAYFNDTDNLVHETPRPLVDWPRSSGIDTDGEVAGHCGKVCSQMNAYAVLTQQWMSVLADRLGLTQESKMYSDRSRLIAKTTNEMFAASGADCNVSAPYPSPPAPPLPPNTPLITCGMEWEGDTKFHHHNSSGELLLNCGSGSKIWTIEYADYGLPSGSCSTAFHSSPNCSSHQTETRDAIGDLCGGKQYCYVPVSDKLFGDPCEGQCKRLAVVVNCMKDKLALQSSFSINNSELNCYSDRISSVSPLSTTATATCLGALAKLPGTARGVLELVPFLKARQGRRGSSHGLETSGWMTGFMLEGLYTAASEIDEGLIDPSLALAAAEFGHQTITNSGNNSWLGMLRQNATMTMESWTQAPFASEGGGTFSHPWTASPAWILPRFLMGIRPLLDGWERLSIRPIPGRAFTQASIATLTPRGSILVDMYVQENRMNLNVTVPGNTAAHLCLPWYLFNTSLNCHTTMAGRVVSNSVQGALLCIDEDLVGGEFNVAMEC